MLPEVHPWLQWPGADKYEKIRLNNKLAEIQKHPINPPRLMDWDMLQTLGIQGEINRLLTTICRYPGGEFHVPMWDRVFRINEPVFREWCLEFYSSLWVDDDFNQSDIPVQKLIHFRCGGKQRHCTIAEFGFLSGMFTREELADPRLIQFINNAVIDTSGFAYGSPEEFWTEISGKPHHHSNQSKVADMYDPVLRVLHKLFSYNFFHRSNQNDKMYTDDLWLMRLFVHGSPYRYACAPFTLAAYMEKHHDVTLCCGHFISRIYQNLGCVGGAANQTCRLPVEMKLISWKDLMASKLLQHGTKRLIEPRVPEQQAYQEAEEVPIQHQQQQQPSTEDPYSMQAMARQLGLIQESQNRFYDSYRDDHQRFLTSYQDDQRMINSQMGRVLYHQQRYQPYMEEWARREASAINQPLPAYAPPEIFIPAHRQGGFYYPYPPSQQGAGSSGAGQESPRFGTYQGGSPSIFPPPDDH